MMDQDMGDGDARNDTDVIHNLDIIHNQDFIQNLDVMDVNLGTHDHSHDNHSSHHSRNNNVRQSEKDPTEADTNEEDEEECRVCRGPAEEGRPLFKPCMCSGSIGLVHQDCLESWLKVQRRDGSCELCKTKFRFAPQYAEDTPLRLSPLQVATSVGRRAVSRWLPLTLRSLFAASLWLVVAPLSTAYLYHGWMARPRALLERLEWRLLLIDLISGSVVTAIIIISFLSLMSFADFLRVEWQQRGLLQRPRARAERNALNNNNRNNLNPNNQNIAHQQNPQQPQHDNHQPRGAPEPNTHSDDARVSDLVAPEDVDNGIWDHVQNQVLQQPSRSTSPRLRQLVALERELNDIADSGSTLRWDDQYVRQDSDEDEDDNPNTNDIQNNHRNKNNINNQHDNDWNDLDTHDWNDDLDHLDDLSDTAHNATTAGTTTDHNNRAAVAPDNLPVHVVPVVNPINAQNALNANPAQHQHPEHLRNNHPDWDARQPQPAVNRDANEERERNAPPVDNDQDDPIDMDINIALDELLGVRGPLIVVVRNLLWLLVFNAVFLGFFAFVPRTVGAAVTSILFNTTLFAKADFQLNTTKDIMNHFNISHSFSIANAWQAIEAESVHQNTALRLKDVSTVALGYLSLSIAVISLRFLWILSQRIPFLRENRDRTGNPDTDDMREAIDEMNRLMQGLGGDVPNLGEDPPVIAITLALGVVLDAMIVIVKVGILLFLKMFLLPILLGLTLDASTIPIFGFTVEDMVIYAGKDLFSFILLHWVAGITFMLLVTVSVLQLREVAHPDLLAQMIRPQEPQPDLLGNLMHESVTTHAKRMILSLIIYALLLVALIYIPARLYVAMFGEHAPFFNLKLCYILTPQLQVPLELVFFHLCMLALLEKYKNCIGGVQHRWLKLIAESIGLAEQLLPKRVHGFRLRGTRAVFLPDTDSTVDSFWFKLSKAEYDNEKFIDSNLSFFESPPFDLFEEGTTKPNGTRMLQNGSYFIRLPVRLPGRSFRARSTLLPTKIGKYRLQCLCNPMGAPVVQLWEEVPGISIIRPPEGWDDLGAGGADVQGRWAWGSEKKSSIELGLATRRPFLGKNQTLRSSFIVGSKFLLLILLSWITSAILLFVCVATPLIIGRYLYYILRVPETWIHDPLAFCGGFLLIFPIVRKITLSSLESDISWYHRLVKWMSLLHWPSHAKLVIVTQALFLSCFVSPILLGLIYDITLIKATAWFEGNEPFIGGQMLTLNWILGCCVLYIWSNLCIIGIFTKEFRLFGGEARDAALENRQANVDEPAWMDADGGGRLYPLWQGNQGRVARFWDTIVAVVLNWEWDKVDRVNLIHNCAAPVTVQLVQCLLIPLATTFLISWSFSLKSALTKAIITRTVVVLYCGVQIGRSWKDQLRLWFEAAHKTALDDRYLIGEILLNYGENKPNQSAIGASKERET